MDEMQTMMKFSRNFAISYMYNVVVTAVTAKALAVAAVAASALYSSLLTLQDVISDDAMLIARHTSSSCYFRVRRPAQQNKDGCNLFSQSEEIL